MPEDVERSLIAAGVEVWRGVANGDGHVALPSVLKRLGDNDVQSLLVEGGSNVLGAFFDEQLVNEVWAFTAPIVIGGRDAPGAVGGLGIRALGRRSSFLLKVARSNSAATY